MNGKWWFKASVLTFWALTLTALTGFLAAAPLKVLKTCMGRRLYWSIGFLLPLMMYFSSMKAFAGLYLLMVVLVGVFADFEERGHNIYFSSACSVILTTLLGLGGFAFWAGQQGRNWASILKTQTEVLLVPVKQAFGFEIDVNSVLAQIPSGFVIMLILALVVAAVSEKRLAGFFNLEHSPPHQMVNFRLPSICVWAFIAALFFSFAKSQLIPTAVQMGAINLLNILVVLFFFQGLAVSSKAFSMLRLNSFWQVVFFALAIFQLFLFVSILGLVDYWADFRARMLAKTFNKKEKI